MTLTLVPTGRGRWSPLVLQWDARLRHELPLQVDLRPGLVVRLFGVDWRIQRVEG